LEHSQTPYAAKGNQGNQANQGNQDISVEEPEVNPLASLNDWLVFPSSHELEVYSSCCFYLLILLQLLFCIAALVSYICYNTITFLVCLFVSCYLLAILKV
jgi:hypothetical protein